MRRRPLFVPRAAVLAIHERLLAEHGGPPGLLDAGRLDAALAAPRSHLAYGQADIFRLAAAHAHALIRNHPFRDGNKRVALTLAGVFLELNGWRLETPEPEAVAATLALVTRKLDEEGLAAWLRRNSPARASDAPPRARRTPRTRGR